MGFRPLPAQRKAQYVVAQIVEAIAAGTFAVGDQLPPERDLAPMLNVGRSSIREAVSMLQIAGILEVRHGSGTYVRRVPEIGFDPGALGAIAIDVGLSADFLQLSEARYAFEVGAVRLACLRREDEGLSEMRGALDEMARAGEDRNGSAFLDANIRFHTGLSRCTANEDVARLSTVLLKALDSPDIRRVRAFYYSVEPGRMTASAAAHQRLSDAVATGKVRESERLLEEHYGSLAEPLRADGDGGTQ